MAREGDERKGAGQAVGQLEHQPASQQFGDAGNTNHSNFLYTSAEDLHPASPPYRQVASTSNLNDTLEVPPDIYGAYPPSPAYRSRTSLKLKMPSQEDFKNEKKGPSVHYDASTTGHQGNGIDTPGYDYSRTGSPTNTDDDQDEDDYDWSGEEDLQDEEKKFEKKMGVKQKKKGWGFKRIITFLFSSLIGSTFLAGVMVTPAILIQFYWYNKDKSDHRRYVKDNVQAWLFWAAANLLISWYLALIVDLVPIIVTFVVSVAWGHVSEVIKSRVELFNSVKNTFKPVLYVASMWASWTIIFGNIYDLYDIDDESQSRADYTPRVYQAIRFIFFFGLVVCAQKMLSHAVAFAFHRTAFQDRLDSVQKALAVIERLRDYRPKRTHRSERSGGRSGLFSSLTPFAEKESYFPGAPRSEGHEGDAEDDRTVFGTGPSRKDSTKKGKNRSSWFGLGGGSGRGTPAHSKANTVDHEMGALKDNTSRPITPGGGISPVNDQAESSRASPHKYPPRASSPRDSESDVGDTLVHAAKALKTAVLHDARNIKGKEDDGILGLGKGVGSTYEAKSLAKSIYMKFRARSRKFLLPSDFTPAFENTIEAQEAFRVFDKDNNGDISRQEIKSTVIKVYQERRSLAKSMRDVGAALKTLDRILLFFALVILFFISLSVFGVEVGDSLTSVYTIGIAASFIFKDAASRAFDSIMFLFVTHPFDTGDRCFVDQEVLTVKRMGLFATVFTRVDGTETYYFNSQLFTKFITNIRRSGKMFENLTMQVAWRTPLSKLDELEKCINEWLSTEENRWFESGTAIVLQKIDFQRYLEVTIGMPHNGTWQDWGLRMTRRTAFHAAVQYYCRQLGIIGYEAPLPVVWNDASGREMQMHPPPPPFPPQSPSRSVHDHQAPEQDPYSGYEAGDDGPSDRGDAAAYAGGDESTEVKPVMFFLPPPAVRDSTIRARKSKSRKAMLRGMDG